MPQGASTRPAWTVGMDTVCRSAGVAGVLAAAILPGSMDQAASSSPSAPATVALPIEGMTCASCVNRIERFLRKTPGVEEATVNLATEVATIRYLPETAGRAELVD